MLKYLLETSETIEEGVGFSQFDRCHMWWLLGFVLFTVLCCALYRRLNPQGRGQMRRGMALAVAYPQTVLSFSMVPTGIAVERISLLMAAEPKGMDAT